MNRRPLSPHLQIYRPQLTSVLSITHRATGIFLCKAFVWIIIGLGILAYNGANFLSFLQAPPYSIFVKISIWCVVWSAIYHWLNGLRHLLWDLGYFLDIKHVYTTGWIVLGFSLFLTILIYWGWMQ